MVKVKFSSIISNKYGDKELILEARTVEEVIDILAKKYGEDFRVSVCNENGKISRLLNLLLNRRNIRYMDGIKTKLKDNDELLIYPSVAGG